MCLYSIIYLYAYLTCFVHLTTNDVFLTVHVVMAFHTNFSCIFHPCGFVPHFHVSQFHVPHFQRPFDALSLTLVVCDWGRLTNRQKSSSKSPIKFYISRLCNVCNFYRATQCHCGICRHRVFVRQSVCHKSVFYQTDKHRITQKTPYDSPGTLVF